MLTDDNRPRSLLTPLFWMALLAAFICIAAGGLVAVYGPQLFPVQGPRPHQGR
jgi:hypothetical protein